MTRSFRMIQNQDLYYSSCVYLKRILLIVLAVVVNPASVSSEIFISPSNAEASVGETVILNCSSNLNTATPDIEWHHFGVGEPNELVYKDGYIIRKYKDRYNITCGIHYCNLIINNVTLDDAGIFICMEFQDKNSEKEIKLIVFDELSTTSTNEENENQPTKANTSVVVAVVVGLLVSCGIIASLIIWKYLKYRKQRKRKNGMETGESELRTLKKNKIIVVGLSDGKRMTDEVFEFNPHRPNENSFLESVPTKMQTGAVAVTYEDQLLVIGIGEDSDEIWKYEKNSGWKISAYLDQGRQRHCAIIIEASIYIVGGSHPRSDEVLKSVEKYDILKGECSPVGELVHAVEFSACVAYKGLIYVFGGWIEGVIITNCVQIYDTRDSRCSLFSKPMLSPQAALRALSWYNSVILLNYDTCFIFDFEKNTWRERKQFKTDVVHFGSVHDDGKVFVFGGGTSEGKDAHGNWIWKCRDEIKCVLLEDIIKNNMTEWKECGRLPKQTFIHAFS